MSRKLGISADYCNRRYTGVGVLIITNYMNKPHFVLGREAFKSIKVNDNYCVSVYEEFGGGIQKPSLGLETNACFELKEETSNLFDISNPEILKKGVNKYFDIPFKEDRLYRIYVVYIENVNNILSMFNYNRQTLLSQPNTYYKYNHYLEMDNIELIPFDAIKSVIGTKLNYICLYAEDNAHNDKVDTVCTGNELSAQCNATASTPPFSVGGTTTYVGMLRIMNDIFISKRLAQFLNGIYGDKSGLEHCYNIFYDGFINSKYMPTDILSQKIMMISGQKYNPIGTNKLKFLDGTYSFDII
jgi:hypothetical protein